MVINGALEVHVNEQLCTLEGVISRVAVQQKAGEWKAEKKHAIPQEADLSSEAMQTFDFLYVYTLQ
jgi:hypothetical protein